MLFYSEDLSDYTFSIYGNSPGFSLGYFYGSGGGLYGISENISKISTNGRGKIFLSLNRMEVARIEIDNRVYIKEISIDSTKTFTMIIQDNSGSLKNVIICI